MPIDLYTFAYYLLILSIVDAVLTPFGIRYLDQEELSGYSAKVMERFGYLGWSFIRTAVAFPLILIVSVVFQTFGESVVYFVFTYAILGISGVIALMDLLIVGMELWEKF